MVNTNHVKGGGEVKVVFVSEVNPQVTGPGEGSLRAMRAGLALG